MPRRRTLPLLLVAALTTVLALTLPDFSTAAFTSSSTSTATVRAADDWTPPEVTMQDPGSPVRGEVTVTATASDADSGIRDVAIEYLPAGGSWTTICVVASSPYSCTWSTGGLAAGDHALRATATDRAGYSATSETVRTTVASRQDLVLTHPGELVSGRVPLTATSHVGMLLGPGIQYRAAGATSWTSVCSSLYGSTLRCEWNTTGLADGDYELRSASVWPAVTSDIVRVTVDNTAPRVTMVDPGGWLSGTRTFTATASDNSGVAQVVIQYSGPGNAPWRDLCSVTAGPWECSYDTTRLANGGYDFRAVATDVAGNTATSAHVTNRRVLNFTWSTVDGPATSAPEPEGAEEPGEPDEPAEPDHADEAPEPDEPADDPAVVSTVSMQSPGAVLTGTVTMAADASSTAEVTSVRIQHASTGTATWTDACTVTTSPYSCSWDTTGVPDGRYDVRAVLVDGSGATTTSAVEGERLVHNTPLRGADVQMSGEDGLTQPGERITFSYTGEIDPATVLPGWSGDPTAVAVRLRDGDLLGPDPGDDTLDVLVDGTPVNLGSVALGEGHLADGRSVLLDATMTAGTVTAEGSVRSTVTVTVEASADGSGEDAGEADTRHTPSLMVWTPSPVVTDLWGLPCSPEPTSGTVPLGGGS